jgi:hypothetical protein
LAWHPYRHWDGFEFDRGYSEEQELSSKLMGKNRAKMWWWDWKKP